MCSICVGCSDSAVRGNEGTTFNIIETLSIVHVHENVHSFVKIDTFTYLQVSIKKCILLQESLMEESAEELLLSLFQVSCQQVSPVSGKSIHICYRKTSKTENNTEVWHHFDITNA